MLDKKHLELAKKKKDDEFYTQYDTVVEGLSNYQNALKGKRVYLNCDNLNSNFLKYFIDNYDELELRGLIATSLDGTKYEHGKGVTKLKNGSFDSEECKKILDEWAEITVTNPPFSIFRTRYYPLMRNYPCIILTTVTAMKYKHATLPDFLSGNTYVGYNYNATYFVRPDGSKKNINNCILLSTVKPDKPHFVEPQLSKNDHVEYPYIDGTDIINIDSSRDIPKNYTGLMAVPLSYIKFHNPYKYKIIDCLNSPPVNGKPKFSRWVIKEV